MAGEGVGELLLDGVVDLGGIATSSSYDVLKFIGSKALERLRAPQVRRRILEDVRQRLLADGMSGEQARFLADLVGEKEFLQRGAMQDVTRLNVLIEREVQGRGYLTVEVEALHRALVHALVQALASDTFTGSLVAGIYLKAHPTPAMKAHLYEFAQAQREPEVYCGKRLGQILEEANQPHARIVVGQDGKPELVGEYTFRIEAQGTDADKLQDALQRVQRGETVTVEASAEGTIRFTTGHMILDRIKGFDRPPQMVRFTPKPQVVQQRLYAHAPGQGEAEVLATVTRHADGKGLDVVLADRPGFSAAFHFTETKFQCVLKMDWAVTTPQYADRNVLKFLINTIHPAGRLLNAEGKQLLKLGDRSGQFNHVLFISRLGLDIIDVFRHVTGELRGSFLLPIPDLGRDDLEILRDMGRLLRGELEGASQQWSRTFTMTEAFVSALGGKPVIELSQHLHLPGSTPLKLVKHVVRPRMTVQQAGQRVARSRIPALVGQEVEVTFSGPVTDASLVKDGRGEGISRA